MFKIAVSMILVLLILVGGSIYYLNISFSQERQAVERRETLTSLGREMLNTVNELSSLAYKYAQTSNEKYAQEYLREVNQINKRQEIVKQFENKNIPESELNLIKKAFNKSESIIELEKVAIEAVDSGNISDARETLYTPTYAQRKEEFKKTINTFLKKLDNRTEQAKNAARKKATLILIITAVLILVVGFAIVMTFKSLYNQITEPINEAVDFANEISNGNLSTPHLDVQGEGEMAKLSKSLNEMQDDLKKTIATILELTQDLTAYSQEISEVDKKINYAFQFIKDVEKGNEETANAVDEISLSIKEIAKGTEELSVKAENISDLGQETFELVKKTDNKINLGTDLVNEAVEIMEDLSTSVNKVDQISEKIMDIADETNLLSLDGAIEAVDGEGSGGFASVADDIKDLADESMESAKEVKEIVAEVKDVTNRAINIMIPTEDGQENIAKVFEEIEGLSDQLTDKVAKVTESTEDQVASTEEISASTEEISAASEEVSGQADEMHQNVKELKTIVSKVAEFNKELRNRFKEQAQKSQEQMDSINLDL